jgi:hypothetical protein
MLQEEATGIEEEEEEIYYLNSYASVCGYLPTTRNVYMILVGNPEGKRPLGRPRRRWVDNIKMDLREIGWDRTG